MPLIQSFISWLMKKRMHQIDLFIRYPHDVQNEWFTRLISSAAGTEWGRKFDYAGISSPDTFRNRVPLQDYETLKSYISRTRKGEQNILWPTEIKWFAKSSGTTSDKSKFIPVSEESLEECHFKGGKDLLSIYCNNYPDNRLFTGKQLGLGGSHSICEFNNEAYYGDLSAILIQNLPFWVEFIRVPNVSIALMDKWEHKIEEMARATIRENVTSLSGVPSWTLVLLRHIQKLTGCNDILEIWPNLELFVHGGVSFLPYREQFRKMIPSANMHYMETYNASEGFFGIQDRTDQDDMLLMLDYGVFYEFIPFSEIEQEHPHTLTLDEVECGKNYALVISTNGGLWRYKIGDTIQFTSVNPYRIKITGRTKSFINAFGEELIVDNAEQALAKACRKTGSVITDYTAAPVYFGDDSSGAHEWLIEFEKKPDNLDYFTELLDNALKLLNSDYEAKRYNDMALSRPVIRAMKQGTFYRWLKTKKKLGGQHKVPRLSNHRQIVEEIISMEVMA